MLRFDGPKPVTLKALMDLLGFERAEVGQCDHEGFYKDDVPREEWEDVKVLSARGATTQIICETSRGEIVIRYLTRR